MHRSSRLNQVFVSSIGGYLVCGGRGYPSVYYDILATPAVCIASMYCSFTWPVIEKNSRQIFGIWDGYSAQMPSADWQPDSIFRFCKPFEWASNMTTGWLIDYPAARLMCPNDSRSAGFVHIEQKLPNTFPWDQIYNRRKF